MCWAATDRLGKIATHLGLKEAATKWRGAASEIRTYFLKECFNPTLNSYVDSPGSATVDAFLLQLPEIGIVKASEPTFKTTLVQIEKQLRRGDFLLRSAKDTACGTTATLWWIYALASTTDRRDEAKEMFKKLLAAANHVGLLSESVVPENCELWGNFPQTTSMVCLMKVADKLSLPWSEAL